MGSVVKCNRMPRVFQGMWDNDFFNSLLSDQSSSSMPAVNVVEKEGEFCVDISAPGFDKKDIDIEVDKNSLKISAKHENKSEEKDSNNRVIRREFAATSFERSFILPENIDTEKIEAKQENGILKISLPKRINAPEDTVKKVSVS